jgi:hypothetical protein
MLTLLTHDRQGAVDESNLRRPLIRSGIALLIDQFSVVAQPVLEQQKLPTYRRLLRPYIR